MALEGWRTRCRTAAARGGGGSGSGACDETPADAAPRHRAGTLISHPDLAAGLCSPRSPLTVTEVADHLVGRAAELEAIDRALDELRDGRTVAAGDRGRARDRQDAAAGRAGRARRRPRVHRPRRAARPSSSATCRSGSSSTRSTSTSPALDPQLVASLREEVRSELAHVLPSLADLASDGRPSCRTSATAPIAPCGELLERLAARRPLVLVLDDVHWADAASVELLDRAAAPPARRRRPDRAGRAPAPAARAPRDGARAGATAHGALTHARARRPRARRGRRAARRGVGRERADALYEEAGGNPFYLQQLARSHGPAAARVAGRRRRAGGRRRPRGGDRLAGRGARAAAPTATRRRAARARPSPATRSSPTSPPPRPAPTRPTAMEALDELLELGLVRADRRPAPLPLPAPARAPRGVRERARRLAARRPRARARRSLAERGAPAAARAHHVEYAARHGDLAAVGRARRGRARRRSSARPPAPPAGSAPRCGSCPTTRRPSSASGSCWPARARSPPRAASPRATPTCSRASRSPRPTRSACACS